MTSLNHASTVYYCWICQTPVPGDAPSDTHYEYDRTIYFCGAEHWGQYQIFRGL